MVINHISFKSAPTGGNSYEKLLAGSQASCTSRMTFWQSKTGGGWVVKYFPELQNILELIADLHSYLLTADSFKLFW